MNVKITTGLLTLITATTFLFTLNKDIQADNSGQPVNLPFNLTERSVLYNGPSFTSGKPGGSIAEGQRIFVKEAFGNDFYKVNTWLGDKYINLPNFVLEKESEKVNLTSREELYTVPFATYKSGGSLSPQNNVEVVAKYKDWNLVKTWSGNKWIHASETDKTGSVLTVLKSTKVYEEETTYSKVVTNLEANTEVNLVKEHGEWYCIWINGEYGWIKKPRFASFEGSVSPVDEKVVLKESVELLTAPDVNAKTGAVLNSQTVTASKQAGGFYEIDTWLGKRWINVENKNVALDLKNDDYYGVKLQNGKKAIWMWNTATNISPSNVDSTISFLVKDHINLVFMNFKNTIPDADYKIFIGRLSKYGIEVHSNNGTPSWALATNLSKGDNLINDVLTYNSRVEPNEQIKGIHFDVEPYNTGASSSPVPEWDNGNRNTLLHEWITNSIHWKEKANLGGLKYSASLPMWLDSSSSITDYFLKENGEKEFYQQMLDTSDFVVLMSYRDTLTGNNSLTKQVEQEFAYAEENNLTNKIMVAIQSNESTGCDYCTFYQKDFDIAEDMFKQVDNYYQTNIPYSGIAMHDFNAYLNKMYASNKDKGKVLPY